MEHLVMDLLAYYAKHFESSETVLIGQKVMEGNYEHVRRLVELVLGLTLKNESTKDQLIEGIMGMSETD